MEIGDYSVYDDEDDIGIYFLQFSTTRDLLTSLGGRSVTVVT